MQMLTIARGLPGSGKSTWACELVRDHDNWRRINRDDLRRMTSDGKWSKAKEEQIKQAEMSLAALYLKAGLSVVIDDTNLPEKTVQMWREFAMDFGAAFQIHDFTYVPVETCIERDRKRQNYVGEKVIRRMYREHLQPKPPMIERDPSLPDAILCDMDGTLAHAHGRSMYDWSRVGEDTVDETIAGIVNTHARDLRTILIVSGRSDECREETEMWLYKHGVNCHGLFMRMAGDNRQDAIVKKELYFEHIYQKYNVLFVLDDRQQVVDLWRSLGLTCLQVAEGDF